MNLIDRFVRATAPDRVTGGARLGVFLFGAVFFLVGVLALFGTVIRPMAQSFSSGDWSRVSGVLKQGELRKVEHLEYTYDFGGVEYAGERFSFSNLPENFLDHQVRAQFGDLQSGDAIAVLVDPDSPEKAVLQRQLSWADSMGVFFSLPFIASGGVALAIAMFSGWGHGRAVALRAAAAERAELAGAMGVGEELRAPDRWGDEDRSITFLNGAGLVTGLGLVLLNAFVNGIVLVFVVELLMMFVAADDGRWFLFFFLIPFEIVGLYLLFAMWRSLRSPRLLDMVITAAPVYPVAGRMEVEVEWAYVGEDGVIEDLEEFALEVGRGKNRLFRRKPSAYAGLVAVPQDQRRRGGRTFVLEEVEAGERFNGRETPKDEGLTVLLVRIRRRGGAEQHAAFTLGDSCEA